MYAKNLMELSLLVFSFGKRSEHSSDFTIILTKAFACKPTLLYLCDCGGKRKKKIYQTQKINQQKDKNKTMCNL